MSHDNPNYDHIQFTEQVYLSLENLNIQGRILDVGGGGEATISQLEGEKVVAIDLRKRELESIRDKVPSLNSLMLVMDATDLQFLDESFEAVTCFFTLMYMDKETQTKAIAEIYRVMKPGGKLLVWDLIIPEKPENTEKTTYAVLLEITLPEASIKTGFGTKWNRTQNMDDLLELATNHGFELTDSSYFGDDQCFALVLQKPA